MLIVTDFENNYKTLLNAVKIGGISEERIDESVLRIVQWKYYMGIMD
jgi:beta-N-acetylhexosaminidase